MKLTMPLGNWSFNPGIPTAGFIDFTYPGFVQENLYAVINTSQPGNPIIFSTSGGAALGGVFTGGTKLYPNYDTSSMSPSDNLQVIYDDLTYPQNVSGTIDVNSAPPTILNYNVITGPLQGTAGNTFLDGSSSFQTTPYRSFFSQIIADVSANGQIIFEGSNNNSNWNTIFVNQVNGTAELNTSSISITASTANTWSGPINYRFMRARSPAGFGAGKIQIFTVFSQTPATLPIPNTQLVDNSGRALNYGAGTSSGSTVRVVTSSDSTAIQPEVHITSAAQTTLGINMMNGTSSAYDCTNYRSIGIQIIGGAGITAGALTWEGSNDNANWFTQILIPPDNSTPTPITSAMTITASSTRQLYGSLSFRYYRLRISTGFTGGSVTAQFRLSPNHIAGMTIPVIGTVSASVSGASLGSSVVTDMNASNIATATTTNSTAITNANAQFMAFSLNINPLSGTNAYQDTIIQSSNDNGATFFDVYHFPRATAAGTWNTGPIKVIGNTIRYVRITSGTSISMTSTILRTVRQVDAPIYTVFFDRNIAPNTLNSTTSSFFVEGCDEFTMVVNMGAITTTAPAFQLEGSEDNVNFYSIGSPLTGVANSTVVLATGTSASAKWIRARVSTGGSGATLGYVCLKGKNV